MLIDLGSYIHIYLTRGVGIRVGMGQRERGKGGGVAVGDPRVYICSVVSYLVCLSEYLNRAPDRRCFSMDNEP